MTLKLECKNYELNIFIKYFIVSFHSYVFYFVFECLLYVNIFLHFLFVLFIKMSHHRCNIHFSLVICIVSLAFVLRRKSVRWYLFSYFLLFLRWSRNFCNRCRLGYSYNVRTMCFVLHSYNNVEFICNLYSLSNSLSFKTLQLSVATSLNGHDMLLIASNASIQRWLYASFIPLCVPSKAYHWNHIHSYTLWAKKIHNI